MEFDILIKNAKIIDGSGSPWTFGDLGICGEKIVAVGNLEKKRNRWKCKNYLLWIY